MIDPRTTVLIGSITSGLMAIVLVFLARATPLPVPGLRNWVVGAWLAFAALLLLGLRDWISDLASVVLGNGALILAYIVWLLGTNEHLGGRMKSSVWLTAGAVSLGAVVWFSYVDESFRVRVVAVAGFCAIISACHVFVLLRRPHTGLHGRNIGVALTSSWFVGLTAIYGLRGLHALVTPQGGAGLLTQDAIQMLYTAGLTVCNVLLVIGFATMASDYVHARIEERAVRDPLTGVLNRRALLEVLEHEISRSRRYHHIFSVAMLDVDHFKKINDQFGHPVGDQVLVNLCQRVCGLVRPHDVFTRYGGEEFMLVMPETPASSAAHVARRILNDLRTADDPGLPPVTVSIGLAEWSTDDHLPASLVARADSALYAAKSNGRNRFELG